MNIENIVKVMKITSCDLQNGNYKNGFNNRSSNTYPNSNLITFQELLEKEKSKQLG